MKIRSQMMLCIALIGVLPLFLAGLIAYRYTQNRLLSQADRNLFSLTGQVATQVESFLYHAIENARTGALTPRLATFIQGDPLLPARYRDTAPPNEPKSPQRRESTTAQFLQTTVGRDPEHFIACAIFNAEGEKLIDTATENLVPDEGNRPWVRIPITENKTHVAVDLNHTSHKSLYISTPIRGANAKPIGVLRLRYELKALQSIITSLNTPNTPFALITDDTGHILAQGENPLLIGEPSSFTPLPTPENKSKNRIQLYWAQTSAESHHKNTLDRVALITLEHAPWTLACVAPPAYYRETTHEVARIMFGLAALVIVFSTTAAFYAASRLSRPITRLAAAAEQIGQGHPHPDIPEDAPGEIGTLARTLKLTTQQLATSHQTLEQRLADLHRSEERFRQLIENSSELILQVTPSGNILYASPNHTSLTGHSAETLTNTNLLDLLHPDDQLHASHLLLQPHLHSTLRYRFKDSTWHDLEFSGRTYHTLDAATNQPIDHLVLLARDRTEHHKAEEVRHQLEQQLHQAQKLDAIGTLASGIAHDFNNLLTGIMGNLQIAVGTLPPSDATQPMLTDALHASHRARDVIARLLTFSRRHETKLARVELEGVILEALSLLRASIPTSIQIKTQLEPNLPPILCDPTQIHQIIMNLGANAAHAMRAKGGTLTIELARHSPAEPHPNSRPTTATRPHDIRVSLRDTGIGMDANTLERIFEPFFTTKAVGEGTGLGLSVVHGIIRSLRGTIHAESTPGQGTTFHLYFHSASPCSEENLTATTAPSSGKPSNKRGNGQTIFIVDDEPSVLKATQRTLEHLGYKPQPYNSASALLEALAHAPTIDALITDYVMPEMHGIELSRRIHPLYPLIPIILVTGNPEALDSQQTRNNGIQQIIAKPYTMETLSTALQEVLTEKNTPLSPRV